MAITQKLAAMHPLGNDDLSALQNAVAGYDRGQLLWSSGYLAGMAAVSAAERRSVESPIHAPAADSNWSIFYATETGNSRRVAELLAERSRAAGLEIQIHDVRDYRPKALTKVENALFVIATHGIGEAPEGSETFFEFWLSDRAPRLAGLNYSILSLGDSSYADFCEMGKVFDNRLQSLGASRVIERVDCDLDFELPVANWAGTVVAHATKIAGSAIAPRTVNLRSVPLTPTVSRDRPFNAEIVVNQKITGSGSSKDVRHIELNLEGSNIVYQPGDSLAVRPQNPPELVDSLLDMTGLHGSEEVTAGGESLCLSDALTTHKEITVLSRPLVDAVALENRSLQEVLADRDKLANFFRTRQVIDVIGDYPKAWQAQEIVDTFRNLTPRLYSIASAPDTNPDEAHLTVAVVRYHAFGRRHWGSASNFLSGGAESAPVYVEPNDHFRLPADADTPIIMIGAGTGIAPYRAFVEHRLEHGHAGHNWLIFGDRNFSSDFLYQIEWLRYRKEGVLKRLDVAFSRDQQEKIYVQHRIIDQASHVYSWLQRGAHIYVCGDGDRMAKDVNQALAEVIRKEGGLTDERAREYLAELKAARRNQRDVY